jgi:TonB family protein
MYRLLLLLLVIATPVLGEEPDVLHAVIIDTESGRVPQTTVAPEYPRDARRDRIEAEVQVCFDVDRYGRTRRVAVRRSTNRAFERPSIRAVKASTFRPLTKEQAMQTIKSCRTFIFALQPVEAE